jgi:ADP-dependent phosphofructokinase/glucokinase
VVELRLRTDLAGLEQRLAQAEWQVAEGKRHVARQRDLVARLVVNCHDGKGAQNLLFQFEELLRLHFANRDRLHAELAAMK